MSPPTLNMRDTGIRVLHYKLYWVRFFFCLVNIMLHYTIEPVHACASREGSDVPARMRSPCSDPKGGQEVRTPLNNYKALGFLSNTGPDPLENYKATKPAVNVQPLSACQRNAI